MKIDLKELALIGVELAAIAETIEAIKTGAGKAVTPDGRWDLLQETLDERPRWKTKVNQWIKFKPEAAYDHLKNFVCEQTGMEPAMLNLFIKPEMTAQIYGIISTAQTCYRERAGMVKKEIA